MQGAAASPAQAALAAGLHARLVGALWESHVRLVVRLAGKILLLAEQTMAGS